MTESAVKLEALGRLGDEPADRRVHGGLDRGCDLLAEKELEVLSLVYQVADLRLEELPLFGRCELIACKLSVDFDEVAVDHVDAVVEVVVRRGLEAAVGLCVEVDHVCRPAVLFELDQDDRAEDQREQEGQPAEEDHDPRAGRVEVERERPEPACSLGEAGLLLFLFSGRRLVCQLLAFLQACRVEAQVPRDHGVLVQPSSPQEARLRVEHLPLQLDLVCAQVLVLRGQSEVPAVGPAGDCRDERVVAQVEEAEDPETRVDSSQVLARDPGVGFFEQRREAPAVEGEQAVQRVSEDAQVCSQGLSVVVESVGEVQPERHGPGPGLQPAVGEVLGDAHAEPVALEDFSHAVGGLRGVCLAQEARERARELSFFLLQLRAELGEYFHLRAEDALERLGRGRRLSGPVESVGLGARVQLEDAPVVCGEQVGEALAEEVESAARVDVQVRDLGEQREELRLLSEELQQLERDQQDGQAVDQHHEERDQQDRVGLLGSRRGVQSLADLPDEHAAGLRGERPQR